MKLQMFSILDAISGTYGHPHLSVNSASAVRGCKDLVARDENIKNHLEDYSLYHIGEFDDSTGKIAPLEQPEIVVHLRALAELPPTPRQEEKAPAKKRR